MGRVSGGGDYQRIAEGVVVMERKFKPFDRVLVRDSGDGVWNAGEYSHFDGENHMVMSQGWSQCIPYEDNEHLVGTNQAPDEPEKFEFGEHVEVRVNDVDAWVKAIYLWPSKETKGFHFCATEKEFNGWLQCRKADW